MDFHRAMDHSARIVGPLLATVILLFRAEQYRLLFGARPLVPGAIAVALLFFVDEVRDAAEPPAPLTTESSPRRTSQYRRDSRAASSRCSACLLVFGLGQLGGRVLYCGSRTRSAAQPTCRCSGLRFTWSRRRCLRGAEDYPIGSDASG
jgi:hypothetical protein